jgi:hypothetical protein
MSSTRPIAKSIPPQLRQDDVEGVEPREKARSRKRDALKRFVDKNAKVLAELA